MTNNKSARDWAIFMNINDERFSDIERMTAIEHIAYAPTHNSITKAMMLDVIRYLLDAHAKDNNVPTMWISVKDRPPEVGQMVLILCRYGHVIDAKFTQYKGKYYFDPFGYELSDSYVTHWMPLPEPPKEDKYDDE